MAGRLGRLGETSSTATQPSRGRLGRIGLASDELQKVATATKVQEEASKPPLQKKLPNGKTAQQLIDDYNRSTDITKRSIYRTEIEKAANDPNNPEHELAKLIKPQITQNTIEKIGSFTKDVNRATLGAPVETAKNLVKQGRVSTEGFGLQSGALTNPELVKNQENYIRSEEKKGTITKEKADSLVNDLKTKAKTATDKLTTVEKNVGVQYNQGSAVESLIDTVSNAAILGEVAKVVFKSAAKKASENLGRDLTKEELDNLALKTKETVPETTAEKVIANADEPVITRTTVAPETVKPVNPPKTVKASELTSYEGAPDTVQVEKYRQAIRSGEDVEPIVAVKDSSGKLGIEDGKHRYQAYLDEGIEDIPTVIKENPIIKEPKGDTVSGNASRIEARAVEKKLTDKFEDKAEFKGINMKEQADEAVKLINKDKQQAIDIIDGKANAPGNLKSQSIHQALEEIAIKEGDIPLLQKLARSHVNTELSESAQNLRIAAERDPHSAVENIRQVRDARIKASEKRNKGTSVKKEAANIRDAIKVKTPVATKQTWDDFISELEC